MTWDLKQSKNLVASLVRSCVLLDRRMWILMAIGVTLLGGCKDPVAHEEDVRQYNVRVLRSGTVPVSGALVNILTASGLYSGTTNGDGRAGLKIGNDVSLPPYVVVTINHPTIMPEAGVLPGNTGATAGGTFNCSSAPSRVLVREVTLHHLGDDMFGGSENSQLQIPSEGLERSFAFDLASIPGSMPRIRLFARGVQGPLEIKINGIITDRLADSPTSGALGLYHFVLTANPRTVLRVGRNVLTLRTSHLSDWDDLEFCSLLLYYS
jgi:hypothetical protein